MSEKERLLIAQKLEVQNQLETLESSLAKVLLYRYSIQSKYAYDSYHISV